MPHTRARILCVEDEPDFRENIVEFLTHESFEVIEAANGKEGIEKFAKTNPDIVLCDVQMPEMDGLDMLRALNETYPDKIGATQFMFLSAIDDKQTTLSGYHMGCNDYITKPVDYDVLLAKIQRRYHTPNESQSAATTDLSNHLPQIIRTQLQRPLDILMGYSELMRGDDSHMSYHHLLGHLKQMMLTQHQQINLLTLILQLQANQYRSKPENIELDSLLWEAYVSAIGYDYASKIQTSTPTSTVIIDRLSVGSLITRYISECHTYYQHVCEYRLQPQPNNALHLVIAPASFDTSALHWLPARDIMQEEGADALIHFFGLSLCLAEALEARSMYQPEFAIMPEQNLALRLTLPLSE